MNGSQKPGIILESERLILRLQQSSDIPFLIDLWTNPEVTRHVGGPRERDWLKTEFESIATDPAAETYDLWPTVEKESGRRIGYCGLLDKELDGKTEIDLNYFVAPEFQGRGFATETALALIRHAFGPMELNRLVSLIDPENTASQRVAVKAGLRKEKTIKRPGDVTRLLYVIEK
jgi:ribosomal-protein-alanine N-acetyltransferase